MRGERLTEISTRKVCGDLLQMRANVRERGLVSGIVGDDLDGAARFGQPESDQAIAPNADVAYP